MKTKAALKAHIFILTAGIHEGKSTFLQKIVASLEDRLALTGFIARGCWEEGERTGFVLLEAGGHRSADLASKTPQKGSIQQGRFHLRPEAFEAGMDWAREGLRSGARLLVIDEVGPLELEHKGWFPLMEEACRKAECACIWVVRESCLGKVVSTWNIPETNIHRAIPGRELVLEKSLLDYVRKHESTET
jgi:nucleoside-triphosphatase THEP1